MSALHDPYRPAEVYDQLSHYLPRELNFRGPVDLPLRARVLLAVLVLAVVAWMIAPFVLAR